MSADHAEIAAKRATSRGREVARGQELGATPEARHGAAPKPQQPQIVARDVRDWKAIDKNHDNLISPEEMEASLKEGAPAGKDANKP